jgi:hypothetical protein
MMIVRSQYLDDDVYEVRHPGIDRFIPSEGDPVRQNPGEHLANFRASCRAALQIRDKPLDAYTDAIWSVLPGLTLFSPPYGRATEGGL